MYYNSIEAYNLKVPAWTWGGKKELFFVPLLQSSFPKKDSFIYKCFISVDKSDYLKKGLTGAKMIRSISLCVYTTNDSFLVSFLIGSKEYIVVSLPEN